MQIFEFLFNPRSPKFRKAKFGWGKKAKVKQNVIFDSFIFEPETIDERKLGHLCIVGELSNPFPKSNLLDSITQLIKSKYYAFPKKPSAETALKESLKKANEFLSDLSHKGDVGWLGNLNLTILTLGPPSLIGSMPLNFTKAGDHKIFLLRKDQIIDISHDVELQNVEPYPPKAFGNIVTGQLNKNDKILVLTKDVFSVFRESIKKTNQSLLSEIAKLPIWKEKYLRRILHLKEKELSEISGICLAIDLSEKGLAEKLKLQIVSEKRKPIKIIISNKISALQKSISNWFSSKLSKSSLVNAIAFTRDRKKTEKEKGKEKKKKWEVPVGKTMVAKEKLIQKVLKPFRSLATLRPPSPKQKISNFFASQERIKLLIQKKNLLLLFGLIFIILVGAAIFEKEGEKEIQKIEQVLQQAQVKMDEAQNALIFKNEELANKLFLEAWQMILPLGEKKFKKAEVSALKEEIENQLKDLNKIVEIQEPDLFVEIQTDFSPQKVIFFGDNLYFYSPGSNKVYRLDTKNKTGKTIEAPQKIKFADNLSFTPIFFLETNNLVALIGDFWTLEINIDKPYPDFTCHDFTSYKSHLYCLNKEKEEILKYPYFNNLIWRSGQNWLENKNPEKSLNEAKSMTIDGSIWILNDDNSIDRYHLGNYQETMELNIFPLPENITRIKTSATIPYLYLLEPAQNRLIILTKDGKIFKQFQSEKFDDLKDFEISTDGKTIWLLNKNNIFQFTDY